MARLLSTPRGVFGLGAFGLHRRKRPRALPPHATEEDPRPGPHPRVKKKKPRSSGRFFCFAILGGDAGCRTRAGIIFDMAPKETQTEVPWISWVCRAVFFAPGGKINYKGFFFVVGVVCGAGALCWRFPFALGALAGCEPSGKKIFYGGVKFAQTFPETNRHSELDPSGATTLGN
ncbi:hypothetical protein LSM04_005178 [Trypanosoma melophagium]|uniref:uncharacterized protein n=1 Tax=Trypanosoma melophagium TaxID=715481 RepID=UPI003519FD23|nr:hypothetical protein LSM04_005178 [Trypanosoma melophagium]